MALALIISSSYLQLPCQRAHHPLQPLISSPHSGLQLPDDPCSFTVVGSLILMPRRLSSSKPKFTCFSPRCLCPNHLKPRRQSFTTNTTRPSVIAPKSDIKSVANSHSIAQTSRPAWPILDREPVPIPIPRGVLRERYQEPPTSNPNPNPNSKPTTNTKANDYNNFYIKVVGGRHSPTIQTSQHRSTMDSSIASQTQSGPRRFKPLNPKLAQQEEHKGKESLRGIVFDVDGTLCLPQTPMFAAMRSAAKIPKGKDILHHIASLTSPEREEAMQAIKDVESEYMLLQSPQPGLVELMSYLTSRGVRKGLLTRNFEDPVRHLIDKFLSDEAVGTFEPVVTRAFEPPKPRPEGMWWIAKEWGLHLEPPPDSPAMTATKSAETPDMVAEVGSGSTKSAVECIAQAVADDAETRGKSVDQTHLGKGLIMVGDSLDDMTAGHTAGAATVLLVNDVNRHLRDHEHTDLAIERLDELIEVLENGFVGHRHR